MKTSELIAILQKKMEQHGDLDVLHHSYTMDDMGLYSFVTLSDPRVVDRVVPAHSGWEDDSVYYEVTRPNDTDTLRYKALVIA